MHPRFQTAFAQLADNLQSALEPILADKYFPALLTGEQVSSLKSWTKTRWHSHYFRWRRPVRVRHCRILMLAQLRAV
jgi:hypothetical protein